MKFQEMEKQAALALIRYIKHENYQSHTIHYNKYSKAKPSCPGKGKERAVHLMRTIFFLF